MKIDVILLPGMHGSNALFNAFVARAPPWAQCRPIELPHSGEQTFAALAEQLIVRLRPLSTFVLFAESFSAPIAARIAHELHERISLLVLCNPLIELPMSVFPPFISLAARLPLFSTVTVAALLAGGRRELARSVLNEVRRIPKLTFERRVAEACSARQSELVSYLKPPLLVIGGTRDLLLRSRLAESLVAQVPGSVYGSVSAPHLAAQVAPSQVWALINEEFQRAA